MCSLVIVYCFLLGSRVLDAQGTLVLACLRPLAAHICRYLSFALLVCLWLFCLSIS
jgi:hypothetical protein